MAEVIMNQLGQGKFTASSAGSKPAGYVHPLAIKTLQEADFSGDGLRSKSWEEFKDQSFDFVITVCDRAREACPVFPGRATVLHWSFEDPAEATGSEDQKLKVFQKVFAEIQARITSFLKS